MHSSSSRIFPDREERRGGRGTSPRGGASVTILTWASALDPEARYLIILHHGDNPYKGCPLLLYTSSRRKILLLINIGAARDTREVTRGIVASGWWKVLFESSPSLSLSREREKSEEKEEEGADGSADGKTDDLEPGAADSGSAYMRAGVSTFLGVNHSQGHPGFARTGERSLGERRGGGEEGEEEGEDRAKDIHAGPSQTRCYDERPIRYVQHSKDPL